MAIRHVLAELGHLRVVVAEFHQDLQRSAIFSLSLPRTVSLHENHAQVVTAVGEDISKLSDGWVVVRQFRKYCHGPAIQRFGLRQPVQLPQQLGEA